MNLWLTECMKKTIKILHLSTILESQATIDQKKKKKASRNEKVMKNYPELCPSVKCPNCERSFRLSIFNGSIRKTKLLKTVLHAHEWNMIIYHGFVGHIRIGTFACMMKARPLSEEPNESNGSTYNTSTGDYLRKYKWNIEHFNS